MAERAFELQEVSVTDQGRVKLECFSINVDVGEAVALVGPSGSGKTAILRLVAGLTIPTAGVVRVLGLPLALLAYEARRSLLLKVGFAFEMNGIWLNRSVRQNILLPIEYHARTSAQREAALQRADELASELGIGHALALSATTVASSVRKRALIARALVQEPEILLVDEPQAGLTPKEAQRVSDAFQRRRKGRGMTLVIADHDGYLHPYIARRVLYLEDGKLADRPSRMPGSMRALALTLEASRTEPPPPED